jgi:hypothetical protein
MNRIAAKPDRVHRTGATEQADERGEHDQRHHARLQQGDVVAEARLVPRGR